jgi:hypothetical protein
VIIIIIIVITIINITHNSTTTKSSLHIGNRMLNYAVPNYSMIHAHRSAVPP